QTGAEWFNVHAIGRCSLRKKPDTNITFKQLPHTVTDATNGLTMPSVDEHGTYSGDQPANHRPSANLLLGNERRGAPAVQNKNINPGNVIGNPQDRSMQDGCTMAHDFYATHQHQAARPDFSH